MNQISTEALTESKTLRESVINRTGVLDKVKKLMLLPDDMHVTVEMAATYYEVSPKTVESSVYDNREELESDGLQILTGSSLSSFKKESQIKSRAASLTIIPRRAILRLGMLLRDSKVAQAVRAMLLDNAMGTPQPTYEDPTLLHFKKEAYMLEVSARMLRLPDSGMLKLLGDYNKQNGFNIPLPAYADEDGTESATDLLEKNGVELGVKKFNVLLMKEGILEEKERPSSKGGKKKFKSITDEGLTYGKNMISPVNPRETQPHYYARKFPELLKRVGLCS